jgi:hypothetical protein
MEIKRKMEYFHVSGKSESDPASIVVAFPARAFIGRLGQGDLKAWSLKPGLYLCA